MGNSVEYKNLTLEKLEEIMEDVSKEMRTRKSKGNEFVIYPLNPEAETQFQEAWVECMKARQPGKLIGSTILNTIPASYKGEVDKGEPYIKNWAEEVAHETLDKRIEELRSEMEPFKQDRTIENALGIPSRMLNKNEKHKKK